MEKDSIVYMDPIPQESIDLIGKNSTPEEFQEEKLCKLDIISLSRIGSAAIREKNFELADLIAQHFFDIAWRSLDEDGSGFSEAYRSLDRALQNSGWLPQFENV